jgi:1,4-dihydroxy-2-naphthoate polyprenyltransferase
VKAAPQSQTRPVTLTELNERFEHAVVVSVGAGGYPMSVATGFRADEERGVIELDPFQPAAPDGEVAVVFSHIRPQPGQGYDERRYVQFWGTLAGAGREAGPGATLTFTPTSSQGWDEEDVPFFEFSERGVPQALAYMDRLSQETGRPVRPKLSRGWLFLRATRLPFLSATVVPVGLGIAIAGKDGAFSWWLALLTLIGACAVQLGLNVANDVFDTMSGADAANVTPTQFSGGSRVVHYGLMRMRSLALLGIGFYAVAIAVGLYLAFDRGFWPLFGLGVAGVLISVFYTAPPLRLVHRGLGEICVAVGFGPLMVLGAYYVQAQRFTGEALFASIPVGILIALVLYMNEVPDRAGDAAAGKRTLPVRLGRDAVIAGYAAAAAVAYGLVAVGAVTGLLVRPALVALATIPLARRVVAGLRANYDSPYTLMGHMATNIKLHAFTGLLLIAAYAVATVAGHLWHPPPVFLR